MRRLHFLRATARKNLLQIECFRRLGMCDRSDPNLSKERSEYNGVNCWLKVLYRDSLGVASTGRFAA